MLGITRATRGSYIPKIITDITTLLSAILGTCLFTAVTE